MSKLVLLGALTVLTACASASSSSLNSETADPNTSTAMNTQSWRMHADPSGFAVEVPPGWSVTAEEGRVTVAGPGAERVTLLPLSVEGQLDAARAQGVLVAPHEPRVDGPRAGDQPEAL